MNGNPVYQPEPIWTRDPISTTALKLIALLFMFAGLGGLLAVWGN